MVTHRAKPIPCSLGRAADNEQGCQSQSARCVMQSRPSKVAAVPTVATARCHAEHERECSSPCIGVDGRKDIKLINGMVQQVQGSPLGALKAASMMAMHRCNVSLFSPTSAAAAIESAACRHSWPSRKSDRMPSACAVCVGRDCISTVLLRC